MYLFDQKVYHFFFSVCSQTFHLDYQCKILLLISSNNLSSDGTLLASVIFKYGQ